MSSARRMIGAIGVHRNVRCASDVTSRMPARPHSSRVSATVRYRIGDHKIGRSKPTGT
jgi:hypothetical protein